MIPKRIHYVWVGSPLPDHQRRNIDTWRTSNPDFELVQWDESNIDFSSAPLNDAYKRRLWAKVADISRLMALHRHGGFYLDVDFHLYRSLTPLLQHPCVLGFQTRERCADWVSNGMLAAEPGHWFIERALARVLSMRAAPLGFDRPTKYGPKLITRLLLEDGLDRYDDAGVSHRDIHICPTEAFFPWPYGVAYQDGFRSRALYGMHMWEKSWELDVPIWIRVAKAALHSARRTRQMLSL